MLFSSGVFLYYFLPGFLLLYLVSPRGIKPLTIAFASYFFYGWWRPDFVILMLVSTVVDYTCGAMIHRAHQEKRRGKGWLLTSIIVNLGLLGYFKYANFGIDTLNHVFSAAGIQELEWPEVVLPIGISFYTFQTLSYTIDVYRKIATPAQTFRHYMCYVAMFPQLVAGPIVRYHTIAEDLHSRTHTFAKFTQGVLAFQTGLAKKVLIADVLGGLADEAFALDSPAMFEAWLGILAYTFQIYFDFSGYSDMAIGLGLMLGFRLPINFNQPYRSISITDFWRRWHISLSSFLRDYLYIPLGGNKKGRLRTYANLSITMLLGGLWHGAKWTFVVWGAYQGLLLIVERLSGKKPWYAWMPRPLQIALTFILVMIGWVLFRAADIGLAWAYLATMFGFGATGESTTLLQVGSIHWLALAVASIVVWAAPTTQQLVARAHPTLAISMQPVFILTLLHLHHEHHVPFLYYQF